ncbi:MAG TPA: hypothetical protein VLS96_07275 [Nodosilinea sp.]|nr:hypothetical protein [Nodosilinea sp.]
MLCLSLVGCGMINPRPPQAVVEAAIAQKLSQTQLVLYRQLDASTPPTDLAQVNRIRVANHHWTTIANQPAVEIAGTYHLKGGGLSAAQRRQTREFDLYLQRGAEKGQWLLLEPDQALPGTTPQWRTTPLVIPTDQAAEPAEPG